MERVVYILMRADLDMSPGKACAQAAHAAAFLAEPGLPVVVLAVRDEQELLALAGRWPPADVSLIRDAGKTELEPGTPTCAAVKAHKGAFSDLQPY